MLARLTMEERWRARTVIQSVRMTLVLFKPIHSLFVLSLGIVILVELNVLKFYDNNGFLRYLKKMEIFSNKQPLVMAIGIYIFTEKQPFIVSFIGMTRRL